MSQVIGDHVANVLAQNYRYLNVHSRERLDCSSGFWKRGIASGDLLSKASPVNKL
jgi:hypothetical protein